MKSEIGLETLLKGSSIKIYFNVNFKNHLRVNRNK